MADSDDKTQTSNEPAEEPELSPPPRQRLAAPLQVRDPERYDVLGEHGRGGLGKVARAHDKELGRNVAIKELIKRGDIGEIRFLREALITARLEHPGIVPIHEAGRWPDGTPFYVMKLVAGRSLKELLAERRAVEQRLELLPHVVAVADAVAYAHKRKIIHRDLKPANVIVGDFGETVVIDWGLAKDLSQPDEPAPEAGPYRTAALTDLTETGTVLGTPTYMAPEQWRGDAVDQRADVFAIGAMLWEVCSTSKVPPTDPRHRDRLLRKAGIDQDLGAIVATALSPEPEKRYRDAGELAVDLKAFTSGARIASRRYSLFAVIRHWVRRHRALASTIGAAIVVLAVGTIVSVLNITGARDRAETAQRRAETEQRRAEEANAELIFENAELLMTRDPTAAVAVLANYRGNNTFRKQRLLAEAHGRGVAESVFTPHNDAISFFVGDRSGAIYSLGADNRVVVTENGISTMLADDVAQSNARGYSAQRQLLAYATMNNKVALLDLKTRTITTLEANKPDVIAFSSDGARLAIGDTNGMLTIWAFKEKYEVIYREAWPEIWDVVFIDSDRFVVSGPNVLHSVSLTGGRRFTRKTLRARVMDVQDRRLLLSDEKGVVVLLSPELSALAAVSPCSGEWVRVKFAKIVDAIAYACRNGSVGLLKYDEPSRSLLIEDSFSAVGQVTQFSIDASGRWVLVATKFNALYVYDTTTRITSKYDGQTAQIQSLAGPTPPFNYILAGDVNGTVRVWRLPPTDTRKIFQGRYGLTALTTTRDGREAIIGGRDAIIRRINIASGHVSELSGHSKTIYKTGTVPEGLFSVSGDGTVRTWGQSLNRVFSEHGTATEAAFHSQLDRIVSVGADGRMFSWPTSGQEMRVLFKHGTPLVELEILPNNGHIVTSDRLGGVWDISPQGASLNIRKAGGLPITRLKASQSGRHLAVATAGGIVTVYDTASWSAITTIRVGANVGQIAFDPKGRDLLVAEDGGALHAVALDTRRSLPWRTFPARVRDVTYHPEGNIIAFVCADGSGWLYYVLKDTWQYTRDHDADTIGAEFSFDGTTLVSHDTAGALTVRHVASE